jgi:hypothetical protein
MDGMSVEPAQASRVAIGKVGSDRNPLPAFGAQLLGFGLELLDDQTIEQRRVLQPAAIVVFEQIACDNTACRFVGSNADEHCALVCSADCGFGELASDVVWFRVAASRQLLPDLLLTSMVVGHCERHQLFQHHAVCGIDVEEFRGDCCELQPLFHNSCAYEESGGDILFAQALLAQGLERTKLVERV